MNELTLVVSTDAPDEGYAVIQFHGELDKFTLEGTDRQMGELLEKYSRPFIILDCGDLHFINSEGVGFMVSTYMRLTKRNQKLILCNLNVNVAEVFNLIGLPKLITVCATLSDAFTFIKKT